MSLSPIERRLFRVTKMPARDIDLLKEGVSIETALSRTVSDALDQVVADRVALAASFLTEAETLRRSRRSLARVAIGRYYYAMYHAMRAVAFAAHGGDDHEKHSNLAGGIPKDFPNLNQARNDLNDARVTRNEADYEPYPASSPHFRTECKRLAPIAINFVKDCQSYLKARGNPYL